jgi:hypothetical protein
VEELIGWSRAVTELPDWIGWGMRRSEELEQRSVTDGRPASIICDTHWMRCY